MPRSRADAIAVVDIVGVGVACRHVAADLFADDDS